MFPVDSKYITCQNRKMFFPIIINMEIWLKKLDFFQDSYIINHYLQNRRNNSYKDVKKNFFNSKTWSKIHKCYLWEVKSLKKTVFSHFWTYLEQNWTLKKEILKFGLCKKIMKKLPSPARPHKKKLGTLCHEKGYAHAIIFKSFQLHFFSIFFG